MDASDRRAVVRPDADEHATQLLAASLVGHQQVIEELLKRHAELASGSCAWCSRQRPRSSTWPCLQARIASEAQRLDRLRNKH